MMDAPTGTADEFVELRFWPGTWDRQGIPEQGCWIRVQDLEATLEAGGCVSASQLAHCLLDWLAVTNDRASAKRTLQILLDRQFPDVKPRCS